MRVWGATYLATGLVLLGLDAVWLSVAASRLYRPKLGPILLDRFNPAPAAAFYLIYIAGILLFAISPALTSGRWTMALARGAMLWLIAYATNDLTNQATLRGWSVAVTVTDRRGRPQALSGGRPCRTGDRLSEAVTGACLGSRRHDQLRDVGCLALVCGSPLGELWRLGLVRVT